MAKDNEPNRYLRSTISNIAFLCLIAYAIHEKAFSEATLVVIVQLFLTGYFGVRAIQNHGDNMKTMASISNPRMQAVRPPNDSDPPAGGPPVDDVYSKVTREIAQPTPGRIPVPRVDETSGRGRYKRVIGFFQDWFSMAPLAIAVVGVLCYAALYMMLATVSVVAGLGGAFQ